MTGGEAARAWHIKCERCGVIQVDHEVKGTCGGFVPNEHDVMVTARARAAIDAFITFGGFDSDWSVAREE